MSSINALNSNGLAVTAGTGTANKTDTTSETKDLFSSLLQQLKSGGAAGGGSGSSSDSDSDTVTVTQVMSDGSVLITVYQDDKIISQTKTHSQNPEENPSILSTKVTKDPDTTATAAGNATDTVNASEASASLMLNMLGQMK